MPTLLLHAPNNEISPEKWTFTDTIKHKKGNGYGIFAADQAKIRSGTPVLIFCKATKKQAKAIITRIEPARVQTRGMPRFDVHFDDVELVPFTLASQPLKRKGVTII